MEKNKLNQLSFSLKALATCTILTLLIGYGVAFLQIHGRTTFEMDKVVEYYRGADEGSENAGLVLPQSFASLTSVSHVHTLSQPMMLGIMGFIFAFSAITEKSRAFFITLSFLGSVLSNATPWLVRYLAASWVYLFPVSQLCIFVALVFMGIRSLYDLWFSE